MAPRACGRVAPLCAVGVRITLKPGVFLLQLSQLRGKDRKFTLMHALVEQIRLHSPQVAMFFQELAEFETVPGGKLIKI